MTLIAVKSFNGQRPIVDARLLSDTDAQIAKNVRLISGKIGPLRGTTTLKATTIQNPVTIFRYGSSATETNYWLEFAQDTDIIRSPIANDSFERLYWTNGNNKPRYAPNSAILSGNGTYPGASYELGIPNRQPWGCRGYEEAALPQSKWHLPPVGRTGSVHHDLRRRSNRCVSG